MSSIRNQVAQFRQRHSRELIRIAKHLDEDGLREAVQLRQGFPALGSERVGLVEDGGHAALFGEGWDGYGLTVNEISVQCRNTCSLREAFQAECREHVVHPTRFIRMKIRYI